MRAVVRLGVALAGLAVLPGVASAHGVTTDRFDAPVPLDLLLVGAAATVGVTALWLLATGRTPDGDRRRAVGSVSPGAARTVRIGARSAFLALFVGALLAGLFGRQVHAENPATLFVWPVWLKGVALVAVVAGSPWRVLAPWRTIYDALVRLEGRQIAVLGEYPERLGAWPALLGFAVVVGVLENLTVVPESPRRTAILVAAGALVMVAGGLCFGPAWFRNADPLDVLYRLLGRVAPLAVDRRADGGYDLALRPPWRGCTTPIAGGAVAAFVVAMVYTVSFDGFTATRRYQELLFDVRDLLGTGPGTGTVVYVVGLAGFLLAYLAAAWLVARAGRTAVDGSGTAVDSSSSVTDGAGAARRTDPTGRDWLATAVRFAPTLLPIAAAYEVAHNYPYVIRHVDLLAAESLSRATPGVEPVEPLSALPLSAFWASQVGLIVLGHLVAVVAAHAVALDRFGSARAARWGHLPLVVVMVGYTALSLWVVSRPVVGG